MEERQSQLRGTMDSEKKPVSIVICLTSPPQEEIQDSSNDINLYRRVRVVDVVFRMFQKTAREKKERVVAVSADHLEHVERFMEHLAKSCGLSKEECLAFYTRRLW